MYGLNKVDLNDIGILSNCQITVNECIEWAKKKKAPDLFIELIPKMAEISISMGVNPLVTIAQCALETGFLRYGGKVKIEQHNTCGLRIEGDKFHSFDSWEEGFTAQVEHLALYAGKQGFPLDSPIDPKHSPSLFGIAMTVQSLDNKWASVGYGNKIMKLINEILNSSNLIYEEGELNNDIGYDSEIPLVKEDEENTTIEEDNEENISEVEDLKRELYEKNHLITEMQEKIDEYEKKLKWVNNITKI